MAEVINLQEQFGRVFRVEREESYFAQYGPGARTDDPHYQIIPGSRGHVYAWDAERLAASTDTTGSTARKLRELSFVHVWQDGTDGLTVLFPPNQLDEVAALLKLRRRRRVSDEERKRLADIGRSHQFRARKS